MGDELKEVKTLGNNGFWNKNGKKFVIQVVAIVGLVTLAALDKVDAMVVVPIIAALAGVNAGAVTR